MKKIKRMSWALFFGVLLITFSISSCTVVQPWEREILSDPIMKFDENPIEKGHLEHFKDFREGSVGATGTQGGGCGCS
ncbi:MAG: DUF4266 domain-containing protein [bacterium]|nr:DUF4266 domain-containing protein [bacterium]